MTGPLIRRIQDSQVTPQQPRTAELPGYQSPPANSKRKVLTVGTARRGMAECELTFCVFENAQIDSATDPLQDSLDRIDY